jgi:hypothetical protein
MYNSGEIQAMIQLKMDEYFMEWLDTPEAEALMRRLQVLIAGGTIS